MRTLSWMAGRDCPRACVISRDVNPGAGRGELADVDLGVLEEIARRSFKATEGIDHCPV